MSNRRTSRVVGVVILVIAGLLVALVGALHLPVTLAWARDFAVKSADTSLRGKLSIGEVTGSPLGDLVIHDIEFHAPGGERIAAVNRATASVSLASLLAGDVVVDVDLAGATVFLRRSADGELNLISALPAPNDEPSTDLPVSLDLRFALEGATVVWRDDGVAAEGDPLSAIGPTSAPDEIARLAATVKQPAEPPRAAPRTVVLTDATTDVHVVVTKQIDVSVAIDKLAAKLTSRQLTSTRAVELEGLRLALPAARPMAVALTAADVDAWLHLADVRAEIPTDVQSSSFSVGQLDVTRELLAYAAPEAGMLTPLSLSVAGVPRTDADGTDLSATLRTGELAELDVAATVGHWLELGPATTWQLSVVAPSVAAAQITTVAFGVERFGAAVEASGQGIDPDTLTAQARVGLRAVDVARYRIENAYVDVGFHDGVVDVREALVQTPYASAAARGSWHLDGKFAATARVKSSDEVQKLAATLLHRKVNTRADIDLDAHGKVDLESEDPLATLAELQADVGWDINDFVAEDVRVDRSTGDLHARIGQDQGHAIVEVTGRATARGAHANGMSLETLDADLRASSRVNTSKPDTMAVVRALTARIDLDVAGLDAPGTVVRDLHALGSVRPAGGRLRYSLVASTGRIAASGLRVSDAAVDVTGSVTPGATLAWPAAVRALNVKGTAAARGLNLGGDAAATLKAKIDVGGSIGDLRGQIGAQTSGLAIGEFAFTTLDADVNFVGDRLFEVDATGVQKDRKPADVGVFLRGRYNRELTDFEVLELRFRSLGEAWNLSEGFSVDTATGTMRFDDVTLTHEGQRVNLKGVYRSGKDQQIEADIEELDLASVVSDFGLPGLEALRGKLSADAEVGGTDAEPTARFRIHLTELYWQDYGPFEVVLDGRYGDRALVIESIEVDGYDTRLLQGNATLPVRATASGDFEVLRANPIEAFLETPAFNPKKLNAAVPALADWNVDGTVSMTTNLHGTLLHPKLNAELRTQKLSASGKLQNDEFDIGPLDSTLALRFDNPKNSGGGFEVSLNANWADQPPIQMLARVRADVAAWVRESLDGHTVDWNDRLQRAPWRFLAKAQRFDLRHLRVGSLREADIEGFVTLDVSGEGTLYAPEAKFTFKLDGFGWNRYRDVFVDAQVTVDKNRIVLDSSRLEWDADEILVASGTIPAPFETLFGDAPLGDLPIDFRVQLQRTNLAKLSAVDYAFASLKGSVGGFVAFNGTLTTPVIEAQLDMQDVEFADRSKGAVTIDASLSAKDRVAGRAQWTRSGKPSLVATLDAPLDVDFVKLAAGEDLDLTGEFKATLTGDEVPIASLVPRKIFDDTVDDLDGRLTTDLVVSGTLEKPTFDGRVRIQDGALMIVEYSREFKDVQLDLAAAPTGLTLHDFHLAGERGYADAQGTLQMDGWKPGNVDGKIEVREIGTTGFTDLAMFVWADVRLDGNFSADPANAKATVSNLEVVVPDTSDRQALPTSLDKDIVVIRSEADRKALFAVEGTIEPVSTVPYAKLAIVIEEGSRVRHPLAQVEIKGELELALSAAGPILNGEVETVQGSAEFLGKKFAIAEAVVTFTGNDPPDPRLQIEANYTLDRSLTRSIGQPTSGDPRAIVRITGRSSDPRIRFLSDPAMPESDVIYVLLTNRPPGQGEVGETGLATGAATGLLTGLIANSPVGKVFDVRVEAGKQGFSDASIEVGRYIGRDVFISLDFNTGASPDESTSKLNIEYRFLPRWIFDLEAGNRGTGQANIFWDIY